MTIDGKSSPPSQSDNWSKWTTVCILIALLPRLLLWTISWSHPERAFSPDTETYLTPALYLLSHGTYPAGSALRTPVYPVFIALTYLLLGPGPSHVILVQVILSVWSVADTLVLGRLLLPRGAAIAGALLMASSLESIVASFMLLSETLFTFLLLRSMLAWARYTTSKSKSPLFVSAIYMGLAILCRPIAVYFPLIFLGLWLMHRHAALGQTLKHMVAYAIVLATIVGPWVLRNRREIGIPTISTMASYNALYYGAAAVEAQNKHTTAEIVRRSYDEEVRSDLGRLGNNDEQARVRIWNRRAQSVFVRQPFRFIWLYVRGDVGSLLPDIATLAEVVGITSGNRGTLDVFQQQGLSAAASHYFGAQMWVVWMTLPFTALLLLTYAFASGGVWFLARSARWSVLILLMAPVVYYLLLPGPASVPRFRVPIVPYLALLSGIALERVVVLIAVLRTRPDYVGHRGSFVRAPRMRDDGG
jgi:hypothetical protein